MSSINSPGVDDNTIGIVTRFLYVCSSAQTDKPPLIFALEVLSAMQSGDESKTLDLFGGNFNSLVQIMEKKDDILLHVNEDSLNAVGNNQSPNQTSSSTTHPSSSTHPSSTSTPIPYDNMRGKRGFTAATPTGLTPATKDPKINNDYHSTPPQQETNNGDGIDIAKLSDEFNHTKISGPGGGDSGGRASCFSVHPLPQGGLLGDRRFDGLHNPYPYVNPRGGGGNNRSGVGGNPTSLLGGDSKEINHPPEWNRDMCPFMVQNGTCQMFDLFGECDLGAHNTIDDSSDNKLPASASTNPQEIITIDDDSPVPYGNLSVPIGNPPAVPCKLYVCWYVILDCFCF